MELMDYVVGASYRSLAAILFIIVSLGVVETEF